mmetsp:Transcript_6271/g.14814  ORF Transcript_6271/g.14814 Transcript_6271/m.14814 type:complete len:443 (+) Transcript_6271:91-1419(+)
MSETDKGFTKVTPGRGKKTNIVTPGPETPRYLQSEITARQSLFQDPPEETRTDPTDSPEEDWSELTMGPNSQLLQLQTLMPERKPFSQPTTKDVITFKRELITALTKCPDPETRQGYAYIMETEEEYKTRTSRNHVQTQTPVRPAMPRGSKDNNLWKAFEMDHRAFMRHQHYEIQALEVIDIMFPGFLDKPDGPLPEELLPKAAMGQIEDQVKDTVVSQQLGNNLLRDILDRKYTPSQNGPREYFVEADDDVRMAHLVGTQTIPLAVVMVAAQQAFMNSGHPKDKIRDLHEEWGKTLGTYVDTTKEYQEFKLFYTKRLRTMYADTYKLKGTGHSVEEQWKYSDLDNRIDQLEYLTAMQSEVASDTLTTISVPSNQPTETSSLETITSALVTALTQAGVGCPPSTAPSTAKKRKWRKIQYYCFTHGANASHASKDCKTPLGDH